MHGKEKKKNKITYISHNTKETEEFAKNFASNAKPNDIYCLVGELGSGKTIIAKGIGKFFNVNDNVTSPTFTVLKSYDVNNKKIKKINHFDLYRIKNINELYNIGFEDILYEDNAISIIEWPEIAKDLIPKTAKIIHIDKEITKYANTNENKRVITYEE